jgi:hypothetical protein
MKSEPRLMSIRPSYPLDRSLWSIQTFVVLVWTLIESSLALRNTRLRMMTLRTPDRLNPPPVTPEPEPTPMTVLFDATLYMPEIEMRPLIRTVCDVLELRADFNADADDTVTTVLAEPPVVPPFMLA